MIHLYAVSPRPGPIHYLAVAMALIALCGCGSSDSTATESPAQATDNSGAEPDGGGVDSGGNDSGDSENAAPPNSENSGSNEPVAAPPNILLIISDDQGLDASAQYSLSNDLPSTPVLDQLARDGLVFDNAWATPACTTTRGTLITGQHGINSGVDRVPDLLPTSAQTLQRTLGNLPTHPYRTAVIGKWHLTGGDNSLTNHPIEAGVDYYAGNIAGTISDYYSWPLTQNGQTDTSSQYHTTHITDLAIDWIAQQTDPWFSWVAYVSPHSPFHLPPADLQQRALSGTIDDIENNARAYYLASIEAMDTEIGRLLDSISAPVRDNTLIIFVGDNGTPRPVIDTNAYIRSHAKGSLYEGGIKVPLIISGANVERSNQRESALVNTVDIYATVANAASAVLPDSLDSLSFHSLLSTAGAGAREFNYAEFISRDTTGWAVRDERYKLIEFDDGSRELYDLQRDAGETNNLISDAASLSATIDNLAAFAAQVRGE